MYSCNYNTLNTATIKDSIAYSSYNLFGGGGIGLYTSFNNNISNVTVTNSNITANNKIRGGGGIGLGASSYNTISTSTVTNSTITTSYIDGGGGIGLRSSTWNIISNITITNSNITANNNIEGGGGIGLHQSSWNSIRNVTVMNSTITANNYIEGGGGIGISSGSNANTISTGIVTNSNITTYNISGGGGIGLDSSVENSINNVTVTNTNITANNEITGGGGIGISSGSTHNTISTGTVMNSDITANNDITGGGGIGLDSSSSNTLSNITVANSTITANQDIWGGGGIGLYWSSSNNISIVTAYQNTISAANEFGFVGLQRDSNNNRLYDSVISDSTDNLIYLYNYSADGVHNNTFANMTLANAGKHAIKVYHSDTINNTFRNITITNTTLAAINITNATDTDLINITFTDTPWDIYIYNATITEYDMDDFSMEWANVYGAIKFTNTSLNSNGANLSKVISITNNSAFVNSSLDSNFNQSANITFEGVTFTNPEPTVDWEDDGTYITCPANVCVELDFTATTYLFNVSHFTTFSIGEPPAINQVNITPTTAYKNSTFNCSSLPLDNQSTNINVSFTWFVNGASNNSWNTTVACTNNTWCYTDDYPSGFTKHYNITCSARAFDGTLYSDWKNSSTVEIQNLVPDNVSLIAPNNGNNTLLNRTPLFNWTNTTDTDGDSLTFQIQILRMTCNSPLACSPTTNITDNTTDLNFTPSTELDLDSWYNWSVRVWDGENWSAWSETWNFSIMSASILLLNNTVNFSTVSLNSIDNTTDNSPNPFLLENNGNVKLNITVYASTPLWSSVPLGTDYFRFKAGNSTEPSAFDWSKSLTSWTPMTVGQQKVISYLNYTDSDSAEIEIYIQVPPGEPSGAKSSTIIVEGTYSG